MKDLEHDHPYFSIITPVHNGSQYVSRYFNCIFAQVFTSWEAIIVDDGSTDSTSSILLKYQRLKQNIHIYQQREQKSFHGPYLARNLAISKACGLYIVFLDIDDCWDSHHLLAYFNHLQKLPHVKLAYSSYFRTTTFDRANLVYTKIRHAPSPHIVRLLLLACNPIPMLTACVNSNLLKGIRFMAIGHEDYLFWIQVTSCLKISEVSRVPTVTAYYLQSNGSQSANKLRSLRWLFIIYSRIGYNLFTSCIAFVVFVSYQVVSCICR